MALLMSHTRQRQGKAPRVRQLRRLGRLDQTAPLTLAVRGGWEGPQNTDFNLIRCSLQNCLDFQLNFYKVHKFQHTHTHRETSLTLFILQAGLLKIFFTFSSHTSPPRSHADLPLLLQRGRGWGRDNRKTGIFLVTMSLLEILTQRSQRVINCSSPPLPVYQMWF